MAEIIHKLLIKTHETGLKYLCYTRKADHEKYLGSGLRWENHLKIYGKNFTTELIFQSSIFEEFKEVAIKKSIEFDIVNSDEWANLRIEQGDGGDTVSSKRWINNGIKETYWPKDELIPEGWTKGRFGSVFNDSEKQKEFNSRVDREVVGKSIKKCWDEGRFKRDHSKCGVKGPDNFFASDKGRQMISECRQKAVLNIKVCPGCNKEFKGDTALIVHIKRNKYCNG